MNNNKKEKKTNKKEKQNQIREGGARQKVYNLPIEDMLFTGIQLYICNHTVTLRSLQFDNCNHNIDM